MAIETETGVRVEFLCVWPLFLMGAAFAGRRASAELRLDYCSESFVVRGESSARDCNDPPVSAQVMRLRKQGLESNF